MRAGFTAGLVMPKKRNHGPRTREQLIAGSRPVLYERNELRRCATMLGSEFQQRLPEMAFFGPADGLALPMPVRLTIVNSLITAFGVHARCMTDFF
jgi:hypothetical protein